MEEADAEAERTTMGVCPNLCREAVDRAVVREMEQQQPSGHRPEGFCCSVMARHDICDHCGVDERSARRSVYAHRGAQAVLERPSGHRRRR